VRQLTKKRWARRLLRRAAALGSDQRAQVRNELLPRGFVLQRIDEPLKFVD